MKHMFGCDIMKKYSQTRKGDIFLIAAVVLAAGLAALFFYGRNAAPAAYAVVEQDGETLMRLPLSEEKEVRVEGEGGYNIVCVKGQSVCILDADCPDKLCVRQGSVMRAGQSIVCLPHRLTVRLEKEGEDGLDAVVR